ncbi:hypothetical protein KJ973_02275 [Patescibacteria group bacterium]|nr:hypothetical protein [Patescibacteria group bacterium]MBU2416471.1 hypothetical protein [Patescibacteria group bacterium]
MCIQSYYNHNKKNQELEFDLLSEMRKIGIKKWNEKVQKIYNTKKIKLKNLYVQTKQKNY